MNAIMSIDQLSNPALALEIPRNQTFEQWVEMGRSLAEGQRVVNWWIGDWWNAGKRKYGEARAAAEAMRVFGKEYDQVRDCGYVAARFKPAERSASLTFDHHRRAAPLVIAEAVKDEQTGEREVRIVDNKEAIRILRRAEQDGLSTREVRVEVVKRQTALGHFPTRDTIDDDPEYTELVDIARRWNRARRSVRQTFLDLANESNLEEIDP